MKGQTHCDEESKDKIGDETIEKRQYTTVANNEWYGDDECKG